MFVVCKYVSCELFQSDYIVVSQRVQKCEVVYGHCAKKKRGIRLFLYIRVLNA
jgi:hypothetical protein